MNIFSALSQGMGSINEANTSSFFAYLMKPDESHGLKREFLFRLLEKLELKKYCDVDNYDFEITLEKKYKNRIIDIQINIFDDKSNDRELVQVIAIENKIKQGAVQPEQFKQEYENIKTKHKNIPVCMVYLAPENPVYIKEFESLNIYEPDVKKFLSWEAVTALLKGILKDENDLEIEPLADYLKHTIRAFVYFINSQVLKKPTKNVDIATLYSSKAKERIPIIYKDNSKYEVLLFENNFVRIKDLNGVDSEGFVVKNMLRDIYNKFDMGQPDKKSTTQDMGRNIIKKIKEDNIEQPIEIDATKPEFSPDRKKKGSNILNIDDTSNEE